MSSGHSAGKIAVLCYHAIADHRDDPVLSEYSVRPARFRRHLRVLRWFGYRYVDADAALAVLAGQRAPARRCVLLTFDDGYENFADVVHAELVRKGAPAVVFVVAGLLGKTNEWDQRDGARPLRLLSSEQLHKLERDGVEIGAHSMTHADLSDLDPTALDREVTLCADILEEKQLRRPRLYSYPFGASPDAAQVCARNAGYSAAFALQSSLLDHRSDPFALPRIRVSSRDGALRLLRRIDDPRVAPLVRRLHSAVRILTSIAHSGRRTSPTE